MEDTNKKIEDSQETTIVGPVNDENVLVLTKPVKFEGKNYKELDFTPFLSATYEHVDTARRQAISLGVGNDYFMKGLTRSPPALRQRYWNFRLNFF